MKTIVFFLMGTWLITLGSGCHKCGFGEEMECEDNIACTEIFVSVTIPFVLDSLAYKKLDYSRTYLKDTNEKLYEHQYNKPFEIGPYSAIILTDNELQKIKKAGSTLKFELYNVSGGLVYESEFVIGHDCCHIFKIQGPDKIIL